MNGGGYWAVLPAAVRHDRRLTQTAKLLYAEISGLAQASGYCWATDKYFADIFECSPATITRALRQLRDGGYIRIDRDANARGPERHIYCGLNPEARVTVKSDDNPDDNLDDNLDDIVTSDGKVTVKNDDNPPAIQYTKSNNSATGAGARAREKKPERETEAVLRGFAEGDPELEQTLVDFAEARRKLKDPIPSRLAAERLVKKLRRLSGGNRDIMLLMLDKAIERGWSSVYELKPDELPKTMPRESDAPERKVWAPGVIP